MPLCGRARRSTNGSCGFGRCSCTAAITSDAACGPVTASTFGCAARTNAPPSLAPRQPVTMTLPFSASASPIARQRLLDRGVDEPAGVDDHQVGAVVASARSHSPRRESRVRICSSRPAPSDSRARQSRRAARARRREPGRAGADLASSGYRARANMRALQCGCCGASRHQRFFVVVARWFASRRSWERERGEQPARLVLHPLLHVHEQLGALLEIVAEHALHRRRLHLQKLLPQVRASASSCRRRSAWPGPAACPGWP